MYNLYVKSPHTGEILKTKLDAIWYVDADEHYSVHRLPSSPDSVYVVVRTLQGRGDLKLHDGGQFQLNSNSLGLFPFSSISDYAAGSDGWVFYWFEFEVIDGTLELVNRVVEIPTSPQERAYMEHCCGGFGSKRDCEHFLAEALFNYLIADWQDRATWAEGKHFSSRQLLALLEKGWSEKRSVASLAREAGMCERSFRNCVHSVTGFSPKEYMQKMDMDTAMELLRTTNMTVLEISDSLGYSNPFYFSRVFKGYFGISPQTARQRLL